MQTNKKRISTQQKCSLKGVGESVLRGSFCSSPDLKTTSAVKSRRGTGEPWQVAATQCLLPSPTSSQYLLIWAHSNLMAEPSPICCIPSVLTGPPCPQMALNNKKHTSSEPLATEWDAGASAGCRWSIRAWLSTPSPWRAKKRGKHYILLWGYCTNWDDADAKKALGTKWVLDSFWYFVWRAFKRRTGIWWKHPASFYFPKV